MLYVRALCDVYPVAASNCARRICLKVTGGVDGEQQLQHIVMTHAPQRVSTEVRVKGKGKGRGGPGAAPAACEFDVQRVACLAFPCRYFRGASLQGLVFSACPG